MTSQQRRRAVEVMARAYHDHSWGDMDDVNWKDQSALVKAEYRKMTSAAFAALLAIADVRMKEKAP